MEADFLVEEAEVEEVLVGNPHFRKNKFFILGRRELMKKIKQILLILVTIMCIFNFMPYIAHADYDGYYIKTYGCASEG